MGGGLERAQLQVAHAPHALSCAMRIRATSRSRGGSLRAAEAEPDSGVPAPRPVTLSHRLRAHFADDEILDLMLRLAVHLGLGRTLEVLQITEHTDLGL
jgi:hypothetical protein